MRRAALASILILAACTRAPAPPGVPSEPVITRSGPSLHVTGPITPGSVVRVRQALATGGITRLSIDSGGGDVEAALAIAETVRDRQLDVEVRGWCMSSCANYIFPSGRRKHIRAGAIVAWHGSPAHLHHLDRIGQGSADPAVRQHNAALAQREAAFLRSAGVDPFVSWFGKMDPYKVPNFYALTIADMGTFGIRDVEAPRSYGPAYLAGFAENVRQGIQFIAPDGDAVRASRPQWLPSRSAGGLRRSRSPRPA